MSVLFQPPDILSEKGQQAVLSFNPGGDLRGIAPPQAVRRQVRIEDGAAPAHQAAVDNFIQGALHEGRGHLGPQIIQNQQVTAENALHVFSGRVAVLPAEFSGFKPLKDVPGRLIDHGEAPSLTSRAMAAERKVLPSPAAPNSSRFPLRRPKVWA